MVFQLALTPWPDPAWWHSWWWQFMALNSTGSRIKLDVKELYLSVWSRWELPVVLKRLALINLTWEISHGVKLVLSGRWTSHCHLGQKIMFVSNSRHNEKLGGQAGEWNALESKSLKSSYIYHGHEKAIYMPRIRCMFKKIWENFKISPLLDH